jgi:hypothetical protein
MVLWEIPPRLIEVATKIGENGWTLPFDMPIPDLWYIADTEDNVDAYFLEYYSKEDNFDRLSRKILNSEEISLWIEVFKQCIEAYLSDKYLITVPALLCITEGLLAELLEDKKVLEYSMADHKLTGLKLIL